MAELISFKGGGHTPFLRQLRTRNGVKKFTLAAAANLTELSPNFISIDVDGATKIVTLPAEESSGGLFYFIYNASGVGEDITLNVDGGGTLMTIGPGLTGLAACDGATWHKLMLTT